jgi:hypothetical protein
LCEAFETGEDYDTNIAVKRVLEGVQGIIDKSQGYNIDKILFIGGNDILHIDSPQEKNDQQEHRKILMECGTVISSKLNKCM